jgi:uncharacterized protein YbaP (TraB family)
MKPTALLMLIFLVSPVLAEKLSLEHVEQALGTKFNDEFKAEVIPFLKQYNRYRGNKAIAVAVSEENGITLGMGADAPSEFAAAMTAMRECNRYKETQNITAECEIVLLENLVVDLGRILRRGLTDETPAFAWKVEGDQSSLYLVGTIHILKPTLLPLAPVYDQFFREVDQVAFEINPLLQSDPQRVQLVESLARADPKLVKKALGKDLRKRLSRHLKSQGGHISGFYRIQPAFTALQVSQSRIAALGYSGNLGLEMHYARQASALGKAVLELESPVTAIEIFTQLPLSSQVVMLDETLKELDLVQVGVGKLIRAWLLGDVQQIYEVTAKEFQVIPELSHISDLLLRGRNEMWLEKIEGYLHQDRTTLVMVGSAHFGGEKGLLQLLKSKGYDLVRYSYIGNELSL